MRPALVGAAFFSFLPFFPTDGFPPGCRFVYEEEQGAESFFVPYVWGLVILSTKGLCWDMRNAELLQSA
eukprot:scaffold119084_cov12-Tisochrysis_lutea.AAC.1